MGWVSPLTRGMSTDIAVLSKNMKQDPWNFRSQPGAAVCYFGWWVIQELVKSYHVGVCRFFQQARPSLAPASTLSSNTVSAWTCS